jgi:hypothetical protein
MQLVGFAGRILLDASKPDGTPAQSGLGGQSGFASWDRNGVPRLSGQAMKSCEADSMMLQVEFLG